MVKTDGYIVRCAIEEYKLSFENKDASVALGNRNAVRGLMMRLNLYNEFALEVNKAFPNIPADSQNSI